MIRKRLSTRCLVVTALFGIAGCGTPFATSLEEARFALDSGDFSTAVTKASTAVSESPNDFQATMVLSSAYSGRAGIDLLELAINLTDVSKEDEIFKDIHAALVSTIGATGLADMRQAILTLTNFAGTFPATDDEKDYRFQLGILQTIESFALPTIKAKPTTTSSITLASVEANDRTVSESDFIAADNNLILSGLEASNQLVIAVRKNYCVLKNRSAATGYTLPELQDLILCQLSANPAAERTFLSGIALCTAFDITNCTAVDTTL